MTDPDPRLHPGRAYDPAREVTVLFGGFGQNSPLQDTWEWNEPTRARLHLVLNRWGWRKGGGAAPARGAPLAFDEERRVVVLQGEETTSPLGRSLGIRRDILG